MVSRDVNFCLVTKLYDSSCCACGLVSAGIELIVFTVALGRVSFGFPRQKELIIERCFSYFWEGLVQSQGLFCLLYYPASERAGGAQGVVETAGTAAPH